MLLNVFFILPAGMCNWMSLPFDQVFKILFSPGPLVESLVKYIFHLWLFSYRNLFSPLNLCLFTVCSFSSIFVRVQILDVEYREISIPSGNSISYACVPNFLMILHGPIFFIFTLLCVPLGNLSFLKCARIKSPTSN
jgi:hypothetical protein